MTAPHKVYDNKGNFLFDIAPIDPLQERIAELEAQLEQLQVQLAGCGAAAMQNTRSSAALRAVKGEYGYSESYAEVCRTVDREITLREQNKMLVDALRMLRVAIQVSHPEYDSNDWLDMIDTALAAVEGKV